MKAFLHSTIAILMLMICSISASAQNISIPDTLKGWDQSWVASLNGSQAAYNNWSQGGVSSISGTGSSIFTVYYKQGQFSYGFRTNLKYGQSNIKGQGVRKTDDLISIRNRFNYTFREDGTLSGYGTINFRTQFDQGFEYATEEGQPDVLISNFFAPAYLSEGIGIAYDPVPAFTFEAGLGLKQTFVTDDDLAVNYGLDAGDNFRSEGGLTTGINFEKEIFEDILYASSVETFTNFLIPINETDIFWSNELIGQINSIVSASFQFELRYDNDFSNEIQLKQVLSAGVSVNLY
ncbi:MAG: DUF3078 domain-containing protein [Gracilimonas sp.]|uniref:DUF3078 domain-containing protein n=1 Tax=Gracilimonas sp. TaxID=1974203 RepID=UPI0037524D2F|nr:DUF3078 domain-containing protein [Gracilimonas sp.]